MLSLQFIDLSGNSVNRIINSTSWSFDIQTIVKFRAECNYEYLTKSKDLNSSQKISNEACIGSNQQPKEITKKIEVKIEENNFTGAFDGTIWNVFPGLRSITDHSGALADMEQYAF